MKVSCGRIGLKHGIRAISVAASMASQGNRWPGWNYELATAIVDALPQRWFIEYQGIFSESHNDLVARVHEDLLSLETPTYLPTIAWFERHTRQKTNICWPTYFDGYPDDFETIFGFLSGSFLKNHRNSSDTPERFMSLPPGHFSKDVVLVVQPAILDSPLWIEILDDFVLHHEWAETDAAWFRFANSKLDMLGTRFGRLLFNVFWRDYGCEAETCSRWASQGTYFRPTDGLHALLFIRDRLLAGQPFLLRFGNIRVLTDLFMMDLYGVTGEVPPKEKIRVPPIVAINISPQFDFVALQPYGKRHAADEPDEPSPPRKRALNRQGWGSLNWAVMDGVSITVEFHGHALCRGQACGRLTRLENNFAYEGWNLRGIVNSQRLMTGRLNKVFGPGKLVGRHSQVIIDTKEALRFDRKGSLPLTAGVKRVVILSVLRTDLFLSGDTLPPEEHGWIETAWAAVGPRSPVAREDSDRSQHGEGWALNSWVPGESTSVIQDVVADGDSGLSGFGYSKPTWQGSQYSRAIIEDERSPVGQGWSDNRWSAVVTVEELERNNL